MPLPDLDDIELTANKHLWNLSGDDSADRITANCANGEAVCEVKDAQSILSLIAEDTAYTGQPVEATVSNEDGAWSEQNELPAFVLEYFQGETKLDGAPVDIGDYTVRLTVGTGDSAISVSKEFSVFKNEIVNPFSDVKDSDYFFDPIIWAFNHDPQITKGTSDTTFSPSDSCTRGQAVTFLWRACGCEKVTDIENPFTDVKASDYYYDAVLWAYKNKITTGTTTTTFGPNDTCNRGQIVTFLWRSQGEPDSDASIDFTDVADNAYYSVPVRWAVEKGITKGTTDETFSPKDSCTRGQIVTFLYRAMT